MSASGIQLILKVLNVMFLKVADISKVAESIWSICTYKVHLYPRLIGGVMQLRLYPF